MKKQKYRRDSWNEPNVHDHYTEPFVNDGYEFNSEMFQKYNLTITEKNFPQMGNLRTHEKMLFKNASIFDVTGHKVTWGDIAPEDVKEMLGVYYVLSEWRSYWKVPEEHVEGYAPAGNDPNSKSAYRHFLPEFEAVALDIRYVKANAIARIVDGEIQTSAYLYRRNNT